MRTHTSSIHNAADANLAWLHEWTNNLNTHRNTHTCILYTHTRAHTHTHGHSWQPQQPRGNQHYLGLKQRGLKLWRDAHVFSSILISFSFSGSLQSLWLPSLSLPLSVLASSQTSTSCWMEREDRAQLVFPRWRQCVCKIVPRGF